MARVVCIGTAVVDTIFAVDRLPLDPGKNFARSVTQIGGGMAANGAVTVAALGGEAVFIGRAGDDASGDQIVREFQALGVDVGDLQRRPGASSQVATVFVDPEGERQLVGYIDPAMFEDADGLSLASIERADALLLDLRWPAAVAQALALARRRGLPTVIDFDAVPRWPTADVLGAASHVAFAREALARLTGTAEVEAGLRQVATGSAAWLAVTCGEDGVYWLDGATLRHQPAFAVEVVDTLAAGDVFHGALALALAERQPIEPAVRFAQAAAAIKCTRFGGRAGIPTRAEVLELLQRSGPRNN